LKQISLTWAGTTVFLLGMTFLANVSQAQTTYPMVCRGTTDTNLMRFIIGPTGDKFQTFIEFTKSPYAAYWGIAPGNCTWLDRPINSNEPARLLHLIPASLNGYVTVGKVGNDSNFMFNMGGISADMVPYFPNHINQAMVNGEARPGSLYDPNTYYTFNVYNDPLSPGFRIVSIRCAGWCS
jgi:hypothetical protein